MTDRPENRPGLPKGRTKTRIGAARKPGWADGLRKMYDNVVNEPLPDSFDDLLKKLDQADDA